MNWKYALIVAFLIGCLPGCGLMTGSPENDIPAVSLSSEPPDALQPLPATTCSSTVTIVAPLDVDPALHPLTKKFFFFTDAAAITFQDGTCPAAYSPSTVPLNFLVGRVFKKDGSGDLSGLQFQGVFLYTDMLDKPDGSVDVTLQGLNDVIFQSAPKPECQVHAKSIEGKIEINPAGDGYTASFAWKVDLTHPSDVSLCEFWI